MLLIFERTANFAALCGIVKKWKKNDSIVIFRYHKCISYRVGANVFSKTDNCGNMNTGEKN